MKTARINLILICKVGSAVATLKHDMLDVRKDVLPDRDCKKVCRTQVITNFVAVTCCEVKSWPCRHEQVHCLKWFRVSQQRIPVRDEHKSSKWHPSSLNGLAHS